MYLLQAFLLNEQHLISRKKLINNCTCSIRHSARYYSSDIFVAYGYCLDNLFSKLIKSVPNRVTCFINVLDSSFLAHSHFDLVSLLVAQFAATSIVHMTTRILCNTLYQNVLKCY